jgi:hypothetical protein
MWIMGKQNEATGMSRLIVRNAASQRSDAPFQLAL